jgi:hypothetical protein
LASIQIPASVGFIHPSAFDHIFMETIAVDDGNGHYSINPDFLFNFVDGILIRNFGQNRNIIIPKEVRRIDLHCFQYANRLSSLEFERGSNVKDIDDGCFEGCSLASVFIPSSMEVLGESWFSGCNIEMVVFESMTRLKAIDRNCFSNCWVRSICIPRAVEELRELCFYRARIEVVTFESESNLRTIHSFCFFESSIGHLMIPGSVEKIDKRCFGRCLKLEDLRFDSGSRLNEIGEEYFCESSLKSIVIP